MKRLSHYLKKVCPRFNKLSLSAARNLIFNEITGSNLVENRFSPLQQGSILEELNSIMRIQGEAEFKELPEDSEKRLRKYYDLLQVMDANVEVSSQNMVFTLQDGNDRRIVRVRKSNMRIVQEKMKQLVTKDRKRLGDGSNPKGKIYPSATIRSNPDVQNLNHRISMEELKGMISKLNRIITLTRSQKIEGVLNLIQILTVRAITDLQDWLQVNYKTLSIDLSNKMDRLEILKND